MNLIFIRENCDNYTDFDRDKDGCNLPTTTYTTNVKGVYKIEWFADPFCDCSHCRYSGGAGVSLAYDSYNVQYTTPKNRTYHTHFTTEQEAFDFYLKTRKKKGYKVKVPLLEAPCCYNTGWLDSEQKKRITEYAEKRGFNKYYDVKIVEIEN